MRVVLSSMKVNNDIDKMLNYSFYALTQQTNVTNSVRRRKKINLHDAMVTDVAIPPQTISS